MSFVTLPGWPLLGPGGRAKVPTAGTASTHRTIRESSSSFYRSIALPEQAEEGKIRADFDKGVLTVRVPFTEIAAPKKIAIGSGSAA